MVDGDRRGTLTESCGGGVGFMVVEDRFGSLRELPVLMMDMETVSARLRVPQKV